MREGWEIKSLDEIFDVKSSRRVHKSDWQKNGVPFYRAREVVKLAQNGFVDNDLFITEELFQEFTKDKGAPKEGDIIISAVGTLGQCYLVKKDDRFYFKDASVLWFENISNVNPIYIEYSFKSDLVIQQVLNKSVGATVWTLTISRARKIQIPIPPLSEQKQIVSILDTAFAAIDQAKAHIEKNIENAKELFQSKLNEIFSQKGDGWEEKRLQDISIEFGRGKSKHRPRNDKKLYGGKYPFVQTGDIRNSNKLVLTYTQTYNDIGLAQSKLWPKGTICITIAANIAETAITTFDSCFPDSIIGVIVDSSKANVDYTYYALQFLKSELQAKGKGSAQDNINIGTFNDLFFPFPSLDEQRKIVNSLDKIQFKSDEMVNHYHQKLSNLEELKKSLLQKAFSGELTQEATVAKIAQVQ